MFTRRLFFEDGYARKRCRCHRSVCVTGLCAEPDDQDRFRLATDRPACDFAEPDRFVLEQFKKTIGSGISINGAVHPVEFVLKDSQSSSNRASTVAQELILNDEVDIILASSTPDTTNPVADQAEINGVPCATNDTPWQPHFFGRKGDPATGFQYTYHFFWGLEDIIDVFMSQWDVIAKGKLSELCGRTTRTAMAGATRSLASHPSWKRLATSWSTLAATRT